MKRENKSLHCMSREAVHTKVCGCKIVNQHVLNAADSYSMSSVVLVFFQYIYYVQFHCSHLCNLLIIFSILDQNLDYREFVYIRMK